MERMRKKASRQHYWFIGCKQHIARITRQEDYMNSLIPCGLDDSRLWDDDPEIEACDQEDPRNAMEKRIQWLCDEWQTAINDGTYDAWRDVSMMIYGASQTLNYFSDNQTMRTVLHVLGAIAFEHGQEQIRLFVNHKEVA